MPWIFKNPPNVYFIAFSDKWEEKFAEFYLYISEVGLVEANLLRIISYL